MKRLSWIIFFLITVSCADTESQKDTSAENVSHEIPPLAHFDFNEFVLANLGATTRAMRPPVCNSWLDFLRGVVRAESNWNTNAVYTENFIDCVTKRKAESVGYFQLSPCDGVIYKNYCAGASVEKLKNPEFNTRCALGIVETLNKKKISLGKYWSVVRDRKVKCDGKI